MKSALELNKEYSDSYVQKVGNGEIPIIVKKLLSKENSIREVVDLGCGDGGFVSSLKIFDFDKKITGIDISKRRINNLRKKFPRENFYCKDICNLNLKEKFDLVYSSQVIEHVEYDKKMVNEILKILKEKGFLYISSVIKKPFAIYKYTNRHGKFVLDPTHEKEYSSTKDFLDLFKKDFKLITYNTFPVKRKFFNFQIKIPGYYIIEGLWKKR